jgi:hypothetical protein
MPPTSTQNDLTLPTDIGGSDPNKLEGWVKADIGFVLGASCFSTGRNPELTLFIVLFFLLIIAMTVLAYWGRCRCQSTPRNGANHQIQEDERGVGISSNEFPTAVLVRAPSPVYVYPPTPSSTRSSLPRRVSP